MTLTVKDFPVFEPGTYQGSLQNVETYQGTDATGDSFTSLRWTFHMEDQPNRDAEMVIFTSDLISPRSRAGEIVSQIKGRNLVHNEEVDEKELYDVPLRIVVGKRTTNSGQERNTIASITRLGDAPEPNPEPDYNDIPF